MKHIDFYFDFVSPYAYLAFEQLPIALDGISYSVAYKPVLFGAMLQHHGQLGPAEIQSKRDWTYRQVLWLAHAHGIALRIPATHPFNSLHLLRLAVASSPSGIPNRYVTEALFHHVWHGGADAADGPRLAALHARVEPPRDVGGHDVKGQLRAHTDEALALGLFGVPSLVVEGNSFWGFDALAMLRDYLRGDAWFKGDSWQSVAHIPVGVTRVRR